MRLLLLALAALFAALPASAQYEASLVVDINHEGFAPPERSLALYDGHICFGANDGTIGYELWCYNPESNEAFPVSDIAPGSAGIGLYGQMIVYQNRLFFGALDMEHGHELRAYDLETNQVSLIADLNEGPNNGLMIPAEFAIHDDYLYFGANDGHRGRELWFYDGITDEVSLAVDIAPDSHSPGSSPDALQVYNNMLYFRANDGQTGNELWVYNPATGLASLVEEFRPGIDGSAVEYLVPFDGNLYFSASVEGEGGGLWKYNATSDESQLLHHSLLGLPKETLVLANKLFFGLRESSVDYELYRYDPILNVMERVSDIQNPTYLTTYGDRIFFRAGWYDPQGTIRSGLWYYDVHSGTTSLATPTQIYVSENSDLITYGGELYFFAADEQHGMELWKLTPTEVANESPAVATLARLHAPHPNPARDGATVTFDVAEAGPVRVEVLDVLGRRVAVLTDEVVAAGEHTARWDAGALPSGLYLVLLTAGDHVQTQRLTLTR